MIASENNPVPVVNENFDSFLVKDYHCGQLDMILKGIDDKIHLVGKRFFYHPTLFDIDFGNVK